MSESREMKIGRLCPAAGPAVLLITLILILSSQHIQGLINAYGSLACLPW